jgi:hypothetical protein
MANLYVNQRLADLYVTGFGWGFYRSVDSLNLAFCSLLGSLFLVSTNAENPEPRSEALILIKAEYAAMAASMNTAKAREAAKSAFDADPEVFRSRSLEPEGDTTPSVHRGISRS